MSVTLNKSAISFRRTVSSFLKKLNSNVLVIRSDNAHGLDQIDYKWTFNLHQCAKLKAVKVYSQTTMGSFSRLEL